MCYLSEVVEVVLLVDPVVSVAFIDAVDLRIDIADVDAITVIHHALEQLPSSTQRNVVNAETTVSASHNLFHGRTRQSYLYNGRLPWYNVVLTLSLIHI